MSLINIESHSVGNARSGRLDREELAKVAVELIIYSRLCFCYIFYITFAVLYYYIIRGTFPLCVSIIAPSRLNFRVKIPLPFLGLNEHHTRVIELAEKTAHAVARLKSRRKRAFWNIDEVEVLAVDGNARARASKEKNKWKEEMKIEEDAAALRPTESLLSFHIAYNNTDLD